MRILVAVGISELRHQFCGGVAQIERHRRGLVGPGSLVGFVYRHVGRIALRGAGKVYRALAQGNACFGHAYRMDYPEGGVGQQQRVRIGEPYVLGGEDAEAAGDEERVFPSFEHPGHPVHCCVGVGTAHALDEGGDDVVMHLAVLVVDCDVLLQALGHAAIVDDYGVAAELGVDHYLKYVEQLAGVAAALAQQRLLLLYLHVPLLEHHVLAHGPLKQQVEVLGVERLQHEDLATRQQGSDDLEGGVFGGGADEHHRAGLHCAEQGVLLGLVETMDLVDEKHRGSGVGEDVLPGGVDHLSHLLDSGAHGREGEELPLEGIGDNPGEGGLSDTRRTPEYEGGEVAGVYHVPQDAALTHKMPLTDIFREIFGPHPLGKRR